MADDDLEYENPILSILLDDPEQAEYAVPGVVLAGTTVCYAGEPGTGKSLVAYAIGLSMAAGMPALSGVIPAPPQPKRVLYMDQENSRLDRNQYLRWMWNGLLHTTNADVALLEENFYPVQGRLGFRDWDEVAAKFVEKFNPHLAIFDTAISCFNPDDENSNAEASRDINKLLQIKQLTKGHEMACIVLRHASTRADKKTRRKMRGATVWLSQSDQTIFQVKSPGRPANRGLSRTRMEPDKKRAFGLQDRIYITPSYTDNERTGLLLEGSIRPDADHRRMEAEDEGEDE